MLGEGAIKSNFALMNPAKRKTRMAMKVRRSWTACTRVFWSSMRSFWRAKYLSDLKTSTRTCHHRQ